MRDRLARVTGRSVLRLAVLCAALHAAPAPRAQDVEPFELPERGPVAAAGRSTGPIGVVQAHWHEQRLAHALTELYGRPRVVVTDASGETKRYWLNARAIIGMSESRRRDSGDMSFGTHWYVNEWIAPATPEDLYATCRDIGFKGNRLDYDFPWKAEDVPLLLASLKGNRALTAVAADGLGKIGAGAKDAAPALFDVIDDSRYGAYPYAVTAARLAMARIDPEALARHDRALKCDAAARYSQAIRKAAAAAPGRSGLRVLIGASDEFCESQPGCRLLSYDEFLKVAPGWLDRRDKDRDASVLYAVVPCMTSEDVIAKNREASELAALTSKTLGAVSRLAEMRGEWCAREGVAEDLIEARLTFREIDGVMVGFLVTARPRVAGGRLGERGFVDAVRLYPAEDSAETVIFHEVSEKKTGAVWSLSKKENVLRSASPPRDYRLGRSCDGFWKP